jgi:hypothetical protein
MTISTTTIINSYSGDGSTTAFTYTFKITDQDDIEVLIRSNDGTETTKTITTHYTVSGVGNAGGGTVTFTSGNIPTSTQTVVLRRSTPQTQTMDLIDNDPMSADTIETAHDKAIAISQELQEQVNRSIKFSRTNTYTSSEFTVDAATRSNKILAFDSSGEIAVTQELGTYKGNWTTATAYYGRDLVKDSSNNNIYICITAHTSSGAVPISSNADSAKWSLLVDAASVSSSASSASSSASAAAASAAAALVSENNSATSESNALSYKTDAETAKTASETAQTAAENAQAAAEAALDNFDDRFLGAKASDPTLDNDGAALTDGALYFDTTNDIMKVYDLSNTTWRQLTLTSANQANVNTVAGQISPTNNIATVAGINSEITTVAGDSADIQTLAAISGLDALAGATADITNVSNNLGEVQNFAQVYRISATAPITSLDVGDLYFDTTANELKVYKASGWSAAGSTVNGTSARFTYNITGTPSSVSGSDANGDTLAYDAGFADVYVNGVRMSASDITITSGTSVVFATALSDGDVVDVVAYGTFNVASIDASNITSGTLNSARLPTVPTTKGGTGLTTLGSAGQALKVNSGGTALEFGDVSISLSYTKGTNTGDNSTTAFTINSGRSVNDVLVLVNGFLLTPTTDYTISGTTLTFVTAPASSAEIVVRYLPLNNNGVYTNDTATGDNSTTAFTIDSGRTVEDVIVTVNGVTLVPATDYTISGTTLTFTTAPTTSAEISIRYLRLT